MLLIIIPLILIIAFIWLIVKLKVLWWLFLIGIAPVSYTHLRAHETGRNLVCRLLLEKKKKEKNEIYKKKKKKKDK